MIILNNRLYSCEQCILRNEGQSCEHFQDVLASVNKANCIAKSQRGFQGLSQVVTGTYRLIIPQTSTILKTIELSKHSDEEILFNRLLDVDISKPVGKFVFILDKFTKVTLNSEKRYLDQQYALPFGLSNTPFSHHELQAPNNANTAGPSSSDSFRRSTAVELAEPVIIRPLSRVGVRYPLPSAIKQDDETNKENSNEHSAKSSNIADENQASPHVANKEVSLTKELADLASTENLKKSKISQLEQFLDETQEFLHTFCNDHKNEQKE